MCVSRTAKKVVHMDGVKARKVADAKKVESAIIRLSEIENILGDDYDLDRLIQFLRQLR